MKQIEKSYQRKTEEGSYDTDTKKSALCKLTRSPNFRISSSLKRGSECSSGFEKVIIRMALF